MGASPMGASPGDDPSTGPPEELEDPEPEELEEPDEPEELDEELELEPELEDPDELDDPELLELELPVSSSSVASPGPPGAPESGGAQCHVESLQQYQSPLQFCSGAGWKQRSPGVHGVAHADGAPPLLLVLLPLPESSPVQAPVATRQTKAAGRSQEARSTDPSVPRHAVPGPPFCPRVRRAACAAASRATGTRNGLQLT